MASSAPSSSQHPARRQVVVWGSIVLGVILVAAVAVADSEVEMFIVLSAVILGLCAMWIPRASRLDGLISARFLWIALIAHLFGALLRYWIIQSVYNGVADANGYVGNAAWMADDIRHFYFPSLPAPGTPFMNWFTAIMFLFTGVTMLGGFVVCATMSFFGSWFFYRAHRVAFPEGNAKLYAWLVFLLPSMWYWPSSLGKDAVIVFFMGLASYGFALLFRGRLGVGAAASFVGLGGTMWVRPPIAAVLIGAAAAALLLRPARGRSMQAQALIWAGVLPLLLIVGLFVLRGTDEYLKGKGVVEAFEAQQSAEFSDQGGSSNFRAPNVFSPTGFPIAIVTSNFRPFPWEAGGVLPTFAALEGVGLIAILLWRRRELWRGLKSWKVNGMTIYAVLCFLGISFALSALSNFGLLARQRVQVLPFLFMLPTIVMPIARRRGSWGRRRARRAGGRAVAPAIDALDSGPAADPIAPSLPA